MKIPREIKGKNKVRDFCICLEYIDGKTPEEIKYLRKLRLSVRRIQQILYENSDFVNSRIGWSKSKRLHTLQRIAERSGLGLSDKKDILNVLEQMRKEIDGDKPLVDNSKHYHQTFIQSLHKSAHELRPEDSIRVD